MLVVTNYQAILLDTLLFIQQLTWPYQIIHKINFCRFQTLFEVYSPQCQTSRSCSFTLESGTRPKPRNLVLAQCLNRRQWRLVLVSTLLYSTLKREAGRGGGKGVVFRLGRDALHVSVIATCGAGVESCYIRNKHQGARCYMNIINTTSIIIPLYDASAFQMFIVIIVFTYISDLMLYTIILLLLYYNVMQIPS